MENKESKKLNLGILIFRIISVIIILICLILLFLWNFENNQNSKIAEELSETFVSNTTQTDFTDVISSNGNDYETINVDFEALLTQNENTVGWLKVNNTNINFPVLQSNDNSYYLTHNFNKEYNSAGWIFADYKNNFEQLDKNTIIYGHNRLNNTMFSNLKYLLEPEWFNDENNRYFIFNTKNRNYIAQIFSVYKINKNNLILSNSFESDTTFDIFINDCISKSIYDFGLDISYQDNIVSLCTCDNNTQYRIVVHGKLKWNKKF